MVQLKFKKEYYLIILMVVLIGVSIIIGEKIFRKMTKSFDYNKDLSAVERTKRFVEWMTPIAKEVGRKYGLPWQALVVQSAIETGWGRSTLLQEANNFGGIKAVKGQDYVTRWTHEYENGVRIEKQARFAKFKNPVDGADQYGFFFHKNKRYAKALQYPNDPYQFITEIRKAGYATSPTYISKLHGMLDKYFPNNSNFSFDGSIDARDEVLKKGARGKLVLKIQEYANTIHNHFGIEPIFEDGIFGLQTEGSVLYITGEKEASFNEVIEHANKIKIQIIHGSI